MKRRKLILIACLAFIICIGFTVYAAISEAINEKHNFSLASNKLQVSGDDDSFADYITYADDRSIFVKNYENGFDLFAVTNDSSDGFWLYTYDPNNYTGDVSKIDTVKKTFTCDFDTSKFKDGKTYYIMAVNYTKYNKFVTSYEDLALLNSEYRHSVINDDLTIGNVTDFYDSIGHYVGDKEFDISTRLNDFYGNQIPVITNGVNTYNLPYNSSLTVDLSNYHRADFYTKDNSGNYTLATEPITITPTDTKSNLYDKYHREITQIYTYGTNSFSNYVFTSNGVIHNGKKIEANATIDLSKSYFENGIVVDDAYQSTIFRNIYVLKDINIKGKLDLIMPCNIHLLNNDIITEKEMTLKHYYTMNYVIDSTALGSDDAGKFISKDGTTKAIKIKTPNANADISTLNTYLDITEIESKENMLDDVLDFAQSFFVDYILVDKYYQIPDNPKKLVSYDYIDIFQGLYEKDDDELVPIERVVDDLGTNYTIEYDDETNLPISVKIGNGYTWYILYKENTSTIDFIYRALENGETKTDTISINGVATDVISYGTEISYIINMESKAEYYTLFLTNPVLPTSFYDEDVTIRYYFADENWQATTETFHVYKNDDNERRNVVIVVNSGEDTNSAHVNAWLMGSSAQAVLETVALKLEVDINRGFASETTTSVLINYDTIQDIYGDYNIEFTDEGHATYKEVMLTVPDDTSHKFIKVTRNSYSLTDGFGELNATITGSSVDPVKIYVQLRKISEDYYDEMIKNEIGQVYFNSDSLTYDLPTEEDLAKYNVKTVNYEVRVSYDGGATSSPFTTAIPFVKDGSHYYLNSTISSANNFELYLRVYITLNDDYQHTLTTDKIIFASGTTGGEGENAYIANIFEEDFSKISSFIGLSEPFKSDDSMIRFYMELDDDYNFVDIYVKYSILANGNTIEAINGDRSGAIPVGSYFYLNESLTRTPYAVTGNPLTSGSQVPISGGSPITTLYTKLTDQTVLDSTTNVVFLTDKDNISKETKIITVDTYVTDTPVIDGSDIKSAYQTFAKYDLFNGIYNSVGSKIKHLTDGKTTYDITYDTNGIVTSVIKTEGGVATPYSSSLEVDLSGFYYNNYIGTKATLGTQLNLTNGIYSEIVDWTPITSIVSGDVTYTITYDSNGNVTNVTGVDTNNDPVLDYTITITNDILSLYPNIYTRNSAQQTVFYKYDNGEYKAITMYKQTYTFSVPGIYKNDDFDTNTNDLYKVISEYFNDELYDEINGSNYYLLASTVENANKLVVDFENEANKTDVRFSRFGYFKNLKELEIYYASFNKDDYSNAIKNDTKDSINMTYLKSSLEKLTIDHCNTNQDPNLSDANNIMLSKFTSLTYLKYTNITIKNNAELDKVPSLYRRLEHLDISNNNISDIALLINCPNLEYLDLRNNIINQFSPLAYDSKGEKATTKLKELYIEGNTVNTVTTGDLTITPYGTPTYNNGVIESGAINVVTLIQILDNNPNLKTANEGTNDFENDTLNSYRKAAYALNAIAYMNRYDDNLCFDITLIKNAIDIDGVYISLLANDSFTEIAGAPSPRFGGNGYYQYALTADASYKLIVKATLTDGDNSYTVYREFYFKEGTQTVA